MNTSTPAAPAPAKAPMLTLDEALGRLLAGTQALPAAEAESVSTFEALGPVLAAGTRLTPQALGLAASVGAARLAVARRPRIALFSTGDELVMPGEPLKPGAIYNSNRYTLRALIEAMGCMCSDLGIVPDR